MPSRWFLDGFNSKLMNEDKLLTIIYLCKISDTDTHLHLYHK